MSDEAGEPNPYAPPKADDREVRPRARRAHARGDIHDALARLDEHLSDPANVEADRRAAGPRIRVFTWGSALVFVILLGVSLALQGSQEPLIFGIGIGLGAVAGVLALVSLIMDLLVVPHGTPSSPEAAFKSFLRAVSMGRFGYTWAALSPTAREQTVRTPALGEVVTVDGEFTMSSEAGMKQYAGAFARPGGAQMRQMAVKKVTLVSTDGDVAEVRAELSFQSWPRWVTILMVVGFILLRPLALIGVVLFFVLRKRHEVTVTKTLLRGRNGAFYLYDADILESGTE